MNDDNRMRAAHRMYLPLIFKLGKLHIRHDYPSSDHPWRGIINVYWGETWVFSKTPDCLNFAIFNRIFWFRKRHQ